MFLLVFSTSVFAQSDTKSIITVDNGEELAGLEKLDIEFESGLIDDGNLINPFSGVQKPTLKSDIMGLAARSTYVGTVKAGKQYHNRGNYNDGLREMNTLGGRGEVVPILNNRGQIEKWRKDGADGTAMYYRSSSEIDGLSRWTITFPGYKVRFMES